MIYIVDTNILINIFENSFIRYLSKKDEYLDLLDKIINSNSFIFLDKVINEFKINDNHPQFSIKQEIRNKLKNIETKFTKIMTKNWIEDFYPWIYKLGETTYINNNNKQESHPANKISDTDTALVYLAKHFIIEEGKKVTILTLETIKDDNILTSVKNIFKIPNMLKETNIKYKIKIEWLNDIKSIRELYELI